MNDNMKEIDGKRSHPRELAEETLQILIPYLHKLSQMSLKISAEQEEMKFNQDFLKLVEGIQLTHRSLDGVKKVIGTEGMERVFVLESQLHHILTRLLYARQGDQEDEVKCILKDELSPHLESWSKSGIPQLIRSRDC